MKSIFPRVILSLLLLPFFGCKQNNDISGDTMAFSKNSIQYAKGLEIYKHRGFSIVKITNPWPEAQKSFTYILQEKTGLFQIA